jgi:hypothetical protein
LRERTLGSTAGVERRAGNCRQTEVGGSSLPSPALLRLRAEYTSHKMINIKISNMEITVHKWKQLILVVNLLFGLRVNEIFK